MSDGYYYFDRMGDEIDERSWETLSSNPRYYTVRETALETEGVHITTIWSGRTRTEKAEGYMPVIFSTTVMIDQMTRDSYETDSDYLSGGNTRTEVEALVMHDRAVELAYFGTFTEQIEAVIGPEKDLVIPASNPCEEVEL